MDLTQLAVGTKIEARLNGGELVHGIIVAWGEKDGERVYDLQLVSSREMDELDRYRWCYTHQVVRTMRRTEA